MKRILIIVIFLFLLVGCRKEEGGRKSLEEYNQYLNEEEKYQYDLRKYGSCYNGHIKDFVCIMGNNLDGSQRTLDQVVDILKKLGKRDLIILMDADGSSAEYVYQVLKKAGYKRVVYYESGYEDYEAKMGDLFTPEVGCESSC